MSAIVSFSDGGFWSVGQRGWDLLFERTCAKLTDAGHPQLCDELYDYGVAFDLQRDEVRLPLARALLDAVTELTPELAAMDQWDADSRGPYFGDLETRLNRELGFDSGPFSS